MTTMTGRDIYGFYARSTIPEYLQVTQSAAPTTYLPYVLPDDALPLFRHRRIDAGSHIRLISLLRPEGPADPGQSKEPIRCTIEVHRLAHAPDYEAVSYTWGVMDRHMPVSIVGTGTDGTETEEALLATPQLLMALRRLRLSSTPRLLWIDQLCIDQDNVEERGAQVQLMGSIYRAARRVVIYLGEDVSRLAESYEDDSNHLLYLIRGLASTSQTVDNVRQVTSLVDFSSSWHFEHIRLRRLRAVYELLCRPWFQRAWVFQEASLAKELCVQFGSAEMKFDDLEHVCDTIHRAHVELGRHQEPWEANLATSTPGYEMIKLIQRTRRERRDCSSQLHNSGGQGFLCKLLQVLRRVECGDQRDLIFAFLAFQHGEGLVSSGGAYQDSVLVVWRMAAQRIIETSSSLDIFAALSGGTGLSGNRPSWVPDWANCFPYGRPVATPLSRFNACRGTPHEWCQTEDPHKLRVRGKIIDTIRKLYPSSSPVATHAIKGGSVSYFLSWACILQDAIGYLYTAEVRGRLGNYWDIKKSNMERDLMRTLIADGALGSERIRRIDKFVHAMARGDEIRQWRYDRASLTDEQKQLVADYERLEDLVLIAQHKNIFFTEHLQIGLAGMVAHEGDVVAILHGSKAPIVLRKSRDKESEYQAICQCYLDGWMYGESPREVFGKTEKDPSKSPHPHGRWWNEDPDDFILV